MKSLGAAFLIGILICAAPASAQVARVAQSVEMVQGQLDQIGFNDVDALSLSSRQIAALRIKLQGDLPMAGGRWLDLRQDVQSILQWDGYAQKR